MATAVPKLLGLNPEVLGVKAPGITMDLMLLDSYIVEWFREMNKSIFSGGRSTIEAMRQIFVHLMRT